MSFWGDLLLIRNLGGGLHARLWYINFSTIKMTLAIKSLKWCQATCVYTSNSCYNPLVVAEYSFDSSFEHLWVSQPDPSVSLLKHYGLLRVFTFLGLGHTSFSELCWRLYNLSDLLFVLRHIVVMSACSQISVISLCPVDRNIFQKCDPSLTEMIL